MRNSDIELLRRIDLNLLTNLAVLLQEKHVSNAARVLCLTQPAVSKNLKKLRELFDDPLLIRVKNHQELTPKAQELKSQLIPKLQSLTQLFDEPEINISQVEKDIKIIASDYASPVWLSQLITELAPTAPGITITIKSWSDENIKKFADGEIDFAFGKLPNASAHIQEQIIGELAPVLIVNNQHPLLSKHQFSTAELAQYPLVKIKGGQQFDYLFEQTLFANSVMLSEASLWLSLKVLKQTDAIMIGGQFLLEQIDDDDFSFIPLSQLAPIVLSISWPKRLENDFVHHWLRNRIMAIGEQIFIKNNNKD